jgi:ribosome recycling factor
MEEEIALYLETAEEGMQSAIEHFKKGLTRIRSGKASPAMFEVFDSTLHAFFCSF